MKKMRMTRTIFLSIIAAVASVDVAWAGNCGDTAGAGGTNVPCSCGDTVVTDTTLISPSADPVNGDPVVSTADADVCAGDGLLMAPPTLVRMTLNLGGNVIRGSGIGAGLRIVGAGVRVSIRNGTLRNFDTGLTNAGSVTGDARIREITATRNIDGISLESNSNELDSNQALDNSDTGIRVAGNSNLLLFNQVSRSGNNGIEVVGDQNRLDTNRLNRNTGSGIVVDGNNNTLDHNTAENNGVDGIQLVGNGDGNPATLEVWKNKVVKNLRNGVTIDGDDLDIVANQGNTNGEDGISVVGTGNHIKTNIARENKGDGLIATGGGNLDDGGNLGKKNGGVQCVVDGLACR
jgi:parallel beta-helix repeat protein